jgi:hypothetical protein
MDPSRYEQLLQPLGAFLASQDARHVEIVDEGTFFKVSWHDRVAGPTQRRFVEEELAMMPAMARGGAGVGNHAALLGQLGREIDAVQFNVARIAEGLEWFLVTGSCAGRYESRRFSYRELQTRGGITARSAGRDRPAVTSAVTPMVRAPGTLTPPPRVLPMAVAQHQATPLRQRLQLL